MHLPILTFHAIGDTPSPLWLSRARLTSLIEDLVDQGYVGVTLSQLLETLPADPGAQRVALAFDDGYRSVLEEALPVLQRFQWPATVFVITDYCGRDNRWPTQGKRTPTAPLLGWGDIDTLARSGWEIAPHTRTHPPLVELSAAQAEEEILTSREAVRDRIGQPGRVFAYPYGAIGGDVKGLVQLHYHAAVGTRLGVADSSSDRFDLERIDTFYLRHAQPRLAAGSFQAYLRLRRLIRQLRRIGKNDWRSSRR